MREADDECLRGAFVTVDTRAALYESGDLIGPLARGVIADKDIHLLGELIVPGRVTHPPCRSVFKSVGVSRADLAAAEFVYERQMLALADTHGGRAV